MSLSDGEYADRLALAENELARLVGRLRNLSANAWTPRRSPVMSALRGLAELTALAEQRMVPQPLGLADHSLADAVNVVGADVLLALTRLPNEELLATAIAEIRQALAATR